MRKILNFSWFFTFILFLAALGYGYAYLPDLIGVQTDEIGNPVQNVSKETFYYSCLGIFVVFNIAFFFLKRALDSMPGASGFYFNNEEFKDKIAAWFSGFSTMINLVLVIAVFYITIFNHQPSKIDNYNFLLYLVPLMFIGTCMWLVVVYTQRRQSAMAE